MEDGWVQRGGLELIAKCLFFCAVDPTGSEERGARYCRLSLTAVTGLVTLECNLDGDEVGVD